MKNFTLLVFVFLNLNVAKSQIKTITLLDRNINSLKLKYIKISNLDTDEIQYVFSLIFNKMPNSNTSNLGEIKFETKIEFNAFFKDLTSAFEQMNSGEAADVKWDRDKYSLNLYDTTLIPNPDLILAEDEDLSKNIRLNKRNVKELLELLSSIDFLDKTPSNVIRVKPKRQLGVDEAFDDAKVTKLQEDEAASQETAKVDEEIVIVEQQAEFSGGSSAFGDYIRNNLKYPEEAKRNNVGGRVYVQFVVNTNGSIQDVTVLKSVGFGCDEEAIRLIKSGPNWNPGKQSGRAVRSRFTQPITFVLPQ